VNAVRFAAAPAGKATRRAALHLRENKNGAQIRCRFGF